MTIFVHFRWPFMERLTQQYEYQDVLSHCAANLLLRVCWWIGGEWVVNGVSWIPSSDCCLLNSNIWWLSDAGSMVVVDVLPLKTSDCCIVSGVFYITSEYSQLDTVNSLNFKYIYQVTQNDLVTQYNDKNRVQVMAWCWFNIGLLSGYTITLLKHWCTLVHVMACCLAAPSHYLNQRNIIHSTTLCASVSKLQWSPCNMIWRCQWLQTRFHSECCDN